MYEEDDGDKWENMSFTTQLHGNGTHLKHTATVWDLGVLQLTTYDVAAVACRWCA